MIAKKIVVVVSAMNMGGAQRVVSVLSEKWVQIGHDVTLIITFTEPQRSHYQVSDKVTVKNLTNSRWFSRIKWINSVWKLISLRATIKAENPDVLISFLARVNVATALASVGLETPLIVCERTWPPFASLKSNWIWVFKILFKRVSRFVVQTEESKSWLASNFSARNVTVIPNPVSFPLASEGHSLADPAAESLDGRKIVLASGRMHKIKQFDVLIKAFSQVQEHANDWVLVILGDGEQFDYLVKTSEELAISGRVIFPGRVGNIGEWYKRADLFVLSSEVEGFPNVLLEAMAYGVPSISFDCDTGPRDLIQDQVNGILVDPETQDLGLSEALELMISNEELRANISKNAILVRDKYSIDKIMLRWDGVLNHIDV